MAQKNRSGSGYHAEVFTKFTTGFQIALPGVTITPTEAQAKVIMQDVLLYLNVTPENYTTLVHLDTPLTDNLEWVYSND